ncbi:MAG TPA: permease-like cell division protein FtsX [Byssovorax sp.]|jgi:cell division transport system permease protein
METIEQGDRRSVRTWRAGRSDTKLHLQAVLSLAVAFVCLAASALVVTNLSAVCDRWSRAGRATVYLKDGATDADVATLTAALESTHGVKRVRLVTAVEARREVVTDEADKLLASLPASAFPTSLEVGFTEDMTDDALAQVALKLRALPAVDTVETYQRWTERLTALLSGGVTAAMCLGLVVLCAVISVVSSTMRHLLNRRRIEVEVLKLVGASDAFVRRPFVIEGATQGALGAGTAILILGGLFLIVRGRFDQELAGMFGVAPTFLPWHVAAAMVALGGALGAATALVSLRKMVRV